MKFFTVLFVLLSLLLVTTLAKRKEIDLEALEKKWAEEENEDDDWHEDTYEWKEKERKKLQQASMANLMSGDKPVLTDAMMGMMGGGGKGRRQTDDFDDGAVKILSLDEIKNMKSSNDAKKVPRYKKDINYNE